MKDPWGYLGKPPDVVLLAPKQSWMRKRYEYYLAEASKISKSNQRNKAAKLAELRVMYNAEMRGFEYEKRNG